MNNITKNLLLALTLVCVIVLVVFCIQLIVINRGVEPIEPGSVISGSPPPQQGSGTGGEDENDPLDGEDGDDGNDELNIPPPVTTRPPPQGTRTRIGVNANTHLIIYYREELFDYVVGELDWWFEYTQGEATLEIAFTMISPAGIIAHTEAFLNDYTGTSSAEFTGEEAIQGSSVMGYHASARTGTGTYEVWIHNLEGSDLALAFIIYYENDQQKEALYQLLSSMDLE